MRWFRMYNDAVDDEKIRLLAFEDRWHYVALLCLKSSGLLDKPKGELRDRQIALKLGLSVRELEEVTRRLRDVRLITKNFQIKSWEKRQYKHDTSAERTREYRARQALGDGHCDVTVTSTETETETDTDTESNARFVRPKTEEVNSFMRTRGYSDAMAFSESNKFIDYYDSCGWIVGKSRKSMKDWKAATRGWMSRNKDGAKRPTRPVSELRL